MAVLVPALLWSYLSLFRPHFTKPSFVFFSSYILSLLLSGGRKTMTRVARTCFWVDRHLVSGVATWATIWDCVLPLIFQLHLLLNQAALRVVDAYFAKAPFVNPLLERNIHLVGACVKTRLVGMTPALTNALRPNEVTSGNWPSY